MRRNELPNKKTMTNTNTKAMTNTLREHLQRAISETFDQRKHDLTKENDEDKYIKRTPSKSDL